jgi:hypothetical protein
VNPRTQILMLQILSLAFIFIIIMMISYHSMETSELKNEINNIEIPSCPACPACPSCPGCPSTNIDMKDHNIEDKINLECPSCPACPSCQTDAGPTYPTVEDIVSGIFPGRNMGLTRGGIYQTLDSSGSYELLPEYDFYKPEDAFPKDTILSRAIGDIERDKLVFDNSYDSMNIDTRMNTGLNGLGEDSLQRSLNRQDESELRVSSEVVNAVPVDDSAVSGEEIIEAQVVMEGGP